MHTVTQSKGYNLDVMLKVQHLNITNATNFCAETVCHNCMKYEPETFLRNTM